MNVTDGELRNLLRLKFLPGERDANPVEREEGKPKATPDALRLCQSQHSYRSLWMLDATPDRRYIPCTTPCCSMNSAQLWRTWGTEEHVPAVSGAPDSIVLQAVLHIPSTKPSQAWLKQIQMCLSLRSIRLT